MPTRKLNVFLCHAKEDKPTVRELYRQLTAEGWMDVWLDEENLFPGQEWDLEIEKAVEAADVVVVCLSTHSIDKEGYVQKELRFVLNIADEKPEGTIFVVPLRLDDCLVPRRIRGWQYADYFPQEERARAYQRLLFSLRMRARKLDISTLSPAEEQARKDAEERAHKDAEEKARKEKEEKDKKAAEEKARLAAERRARREREAREKKEAEAKAISDAKEKPAESPVGIGRDSKDSNIVTGDNNVIVQFASPVAKQVESPRSASVPVSASSTRAEKKTPSQPNVRAWFVLGGLLMIVLCGFGITYLIQNWPASPPPTQTSEVSTASPTLHLPTEPPTVTVTPTPEPGVGDTWISPKDDMVMMFVPAGEFSMGSDVGSSDEQPVHNVTLDSYWMNETEVTNEMFVDFLNDVVSQITVESDEFVKYQGNTIYDLICSGCSSWTDRISWNGSRFSVVSGYENHPVALVTWYGANNYCVWRGEGMRLPTEAEWEKAASWDDDKKEKRVYPWGDSIDCSYANYWGKDGGCVGDTTKVGNYPSGASFYGLMDMAGNVWEWVADWYDATYYSSLPPNPFNPLGPNTGNSRVLRGGSWDGYVVSVRSSNRNRSDPANTYNGIGFRCARPLP